MPNIVVTWAKLLGPLFSIQITQFCGNLSKVVGKTSQPPFSFFERWDGNESVTFQQNVNYTFNKNMSCITLFVFLYAILRRSQMLLTFSRYQMMYNVSYVVLFAEVTYEGYFVIQEQSNEQNQALDLWSLPALFHIYASFQS